MRLLADAFGGCFGLSGVSLRTEVFPYNQREESLCCLRPVTAVNIHHGFTIYTPKTSSTPPHLSRLPRQSQAWTEHFPVTRGPYDARITSREHRADDYSIRTGETSPAHPESESLVSGYATRSSIDNRVGANPRQKKCRPAKDVYSRSQKVGTSFSSCP